MELFASAIPHFPPEKTPLGLPTESVTTPTFSGGGLCERYGMYSNSPGSGSSDGLIPRSNSIGSSIKGEYKNTFTERALGAHTCNF